MTLSTAACKREPWHPGRASARRCMDEPSGSTSQTNTESRDPAVVILDADLPRTAAQKQHIHWGSRIDELHLRVRGRLRTAIHGAVLCGYGNKLCDLLAQLTVLRVGVNIPFLHTGNLPPSHSSGRLWENLMCSGSGGWGKQSACGCACSHRITPVRELNKCCENHCPASILRIHGLAARTHADSESQTLPATAAFG